MKTTQTIKDRYTTTMMHSMLMRRNSKRSSNIRLPRPHAGETRVSPLCFKVWGGLQLAGHFLGTPKEGLSPTASPDRGSKHNVVVILLQGGSPGSE